MISGYFGIFTFYRWLRKWISGTVGMAMISAVLSAVMLIFIN